jgi:hypothetical protein
VYKGARRGKKRENASVLYDRWPKMKDLPKKKKRKKSPKFRRSLLSPSAIIDDSTIFFWGTSGSETMGRAGAEGVR